MTANIGNTDRWIRIVIGVGALAAGYVFKSYWGLVGLVPLLTAGMRCCPLYSLLGIKTCSVNKTSSAS